MPSLLTAVTAAWLVGVAAVGCGRGERAEEPRLLERDAVVEAGLAGGARHRYAVAVAAGDYVELTARQLGVDVGLDIADGRGRPVALELDIVGGRGEEERAGL